jgi:hypothetical protein
VEESEREKGIIAAEVLSIAPNAFCKAAVKYPRSVMCLTMLVPTLMSVIALGVYGMEVDFSLDSFRIRDHPVAVGLQSHSRVSDWLHDGPRRLSSIEPCSDQCKINVSEKCQPYAAELQDAFVSAKEDSDMAWRLYYGAQTWGEYALAAGKPGANQAAAEAEGLAVASEPGGGGEGTGPPVAGAGPGGGGAVQVKSVLPKA